MRQKRLAKLAQQQREQQEQQSSTPPPPPPPTSGEAEPSPKPGSSLAKENEKPNEIPNRKINITPSSASSPSAGAPNNPFAQLGVKSKTGSGSSTPTVNDSGNSDTLKRSRSAIDKTPANTTTPPAKKLYTGTKEEPLEDWSDRVLSDIFRVTLDESRSLDNRSNGGPKPTYLPELRAELEQSGDPVKLTAASIDAAILEAARYVPTDRALLEYLLPCWKRVVRALKMASRRPHPEWDVVLNEAKRLCMSNCIFALSMPEYFG